MAPMTMDVAPMWMTVEKLLACVCVGGDSTNWAIQVDFFLAANGYPGLLPISKFSDKPKDQCSPECEQTFYRIIFKFFGFF